MPGLNIRTILLQEIARAEAVVKTASDSRKRGHQPTLNNFEGQLLALKKIEAWLDSPLVLRYNRGELLEWYVNARTDGWKCQSAMPNSDYWEHAYLKRGKLKAEIDIPGGTLIVWDKDNNEIQKVMPYDF